jgi:hypothetical protein
VPIQLQNEKMKFLKLTGYGLAALLILGAIAHGVFGLPAIHQQMRDSGIPRDTALWIDATAGWLFGSMSMLTFGFIVAAVARVLSDRHGIVIFPVMAIGVGYLAFGAGCLAGIHWSPHFVGFAILGTLLLVWSMAARRIIIRSHRCDIMGLVDRDV